MKYTISNILKTNSKKFNNNDYIFEKEDGVFKSHSYNEFYNDVLKVASLLQKNHNTNDCIMMYAENSYKYMVVDAAIMGYTCISVTVSKEWSVYDLENSIGIINPKTIIYSSLKEDNIKEIKKKFKNIKYLKIENIIPKSLGEAE